MHHKELVAQIQRMGNSYATVERKLVFEHRGVNLHGSEIHFMEAVSEQPTLNLTGLAGEMGITKGALSQTLSRLEAKGMMTKESDPYNKNRLHMELTKPGKEALAAFRQKISREWRELSAYLDSLEQRDYQMLGQFLARLETFFRRLG